jgi:hypothetical protein
MILKSIHIEAKPLEHRGFGRGDARYLITHQIEASDIKFFFLALADIWT